MTLVVFFPCCRNDFVNFDDPVYVSDNPHVRNGLNREDAEWAFTTYYADNWHPLTWLSLQLDSQICGLRPWGFHLTNVLLHTASTLVLFWALRELTGRIWPSAFVAALFAFHPLHVESVAWVAERKDVLSGLFWMLALLAYAWYISRPSWKRYLLVAAAMALGLPAKPMLVTLPCVFLLLDYWPLGRFSGRGEVVRCWGGNAASKSAPVSTTILPRNRGTPLHHLTTPQPRHVSIHNFHARFGILVIEKLPLFALTAASSVVTWKAQRESAIRSLVDYPLSIRLANALLSYCAYVGQTLWPVHLGAFYPHPAGEMATSSGMPIPLWQLLGAFLLLLMVSILAIGKRRSMPYVFVGWFWYVGTLVPVIGVIQLSGQARADRYTYIPLVGLFLAAAWGLDEFSLRRRSPYAAMCIAACVVILLMLQSLVQVSYWQDSRALWQHALEVCGESAVAHSNLAHVLREQGELQEAAKHDRAAVRIQPGYSVAHNNLGLTLFMLGQETEAFKEWDEALRLQPEWEGPRYNRALAFVRQGKTAEAIAEYELVLRQHPNLGKAHLDVAVLYLRDGKSKKAEEHLREALAFALARRQKDIADEIQQVLDLHKSGKLFRTNPTVKPP
jgi:tetratricopeptide (TPR) repeat protein